MNKTSQDNMNDKVTMPALTALLSVRSGDSKEQVESFLQELFDIIVSELEKGEAVKVPGIGIFKTIDVESRKSVNVNTGEEVLIPGHKKVVFLPCKELADTVNEPFQMFQTLELTDEMAAEFDSQSSELAQSDIGEREFISATEDKSEITDVTEMKTDSSQEEKTSVGSEDNEICARPEVCGTLEGNDKSESLGQSAGLEYEEIHEDVERSQDSESLNCKDIADESGLSEEPELIVVKRRFWPGFFTGFGVAAVCGLLIWGIVSIMNVTQSDTDDREAKLMPVKEETAPVLSDTADYQESDIVSHKDTVDIVAIDEGRTSQPSVPTQPSDQPKYDTITKTRYLTTMAKDHYGNYHLWPYIYKENEKILGHPDRIKPGTKVVVPDLSKYGVDPKNPADIAKAKKLGTAIYEKYR